VRDLRDLARSDESPRVEVSLSGEFDGLAPPVSGAIYRIAREAITNALQHASHATRIEVAVAGDHDAVRLEVRDDGEAVSAARNPAGYGLVGMTERAAVLGGSVDAGPAPGCGWTVTAVIPRAGTAA
jgi:signal transduction histidine kinase